MLTVYRNLVLTLALVVCPTAAAQDRTQQIDPEFQIGATVGGGWYDLGYHWYESEESVVSNGNGMGVTFGATTRVGLSTQPGLGLMAAVQASLLSAATADERFLLADLSGVFGLKIPVFLDGRSTVLLAGLLGIGFTNSASVDGSGLTFGALGQYRFDNLFLEARYQRWVLDADNGQPLLDADLWIHQVLGSVGLAL